MKLTPEQLVAARMAREAKEGGAIKKEGETPDRVPERFVSQKGFEVTFDQKLVVYQMAWGGHADIAVRFIMPNGTIKEEVKFGLGNRAEALKKFDELVKQAKDWDKIGT
ncbi:MAG TPA: hypothetical protein DDW36_01560 [Candidatus Magasanikbacteria bacterium]|nr:hypothetical protein [Candidatus Magasanikbacteria bacterium]